MTKAYEVAIRLLSRREHSVHELKEKLLQKGHVLAEITEALAQCQRLGYLSDVRYAEQLCRYRANQGIGPLRIRHELLNQRVESAIVEEVLGAFEQAWVANAKAVWHKKYGEAPETSFEQQQKQKRFLAYRGFSHETIASALDE